jgi:sugar diacid utilization regulator
MVLAARPGLRRAPDVRAVTAAFAELAPELSLHLTAVPAGIAVLAGAQSDEHEGALESIAALALERVCMRLEPSGGVVGGLSGVRSDAAGYRAAYADARRVVECLLRFGRRGGPLVSTAERLGGGLVFLATADRDDVARFADETLGWLVDDPSMADLLSTLCSFFDNVASIRRCAASLGVHENTIRYRLGRIEELSGLAVAHEPDAQLQARLSMLVLQLQGRVADTRGGLVADAVSPRALEVVAAGSR